MPSSNETVKPATAADAQEQSVTVAGPTLPLDPSQPVSADEMMSQEEISALLAEMKAEQTAASQPPAGQAETADGEPPAAATAANGSKSVDVPSPAAQKAPAGIGRLPAVKPLVLLASALILLALAGLSGYIAAIQAPEAAAGNSLETQLKARGVRYLPDDFVKYAGRGNQEITDLFLQSGMPPDAYRSSDGFTPLMAAASFGRLEIISRLLEQGASLNSKDKDGQTALMKAAAYNYPEAAGLLLQAGADYSISDSRGRNAASLALERKDPQMLKLLAQAGIIKADAAPAPGKAGPQPAGQPPQQPQAQPAEFTLAGRKAGYMQIGQPLASVYQQYSRKNATITTDHTPYPTVKVYLDGRATPSLIGSVSIRNQGIDQIIDGIHVYDERFKTVRGIGINSTLGDLRQAGGFDDIRHIDQSLYAIAKDIAFELSISIDTLPFDWLETGQTSSLSDNITIQSVIVR
ncbi:ankyrin repeat domain-containing protein|uniref:Ankyrin repeat-containing protein n=1 Tax=Dendrosporobacter quercicolus TaxID=146817 RepID=A0A1G9U4I7_9FIRM|nr:ankyrin repeat domain-containing protein [Dendrosporobacter quercicolus]NSL48766.1 ankyrin repeat domain-containing protein [Dendrosporobacter quercicolus DSM 1736]SDM54574.1 Ankyrin repeat-containing protein [Dendrosporobacter quercicolus]